MKNLKTLLPLLLLLIPVIGSAQSLIKCNDSTSFYVHQKDDFYCYIKLTGKLSESGNSSVVVINGNALQSLLINKQNYLLNGIDDISILKTYMVSETKYYTGIFKEKLNLMMALVEISKDKKAIIWYFDIPDNLQKQQVQQVQPEMIPAVKQVFISIVVGDFVYSIVTTQFKGRSFDDLKKLLLDSIMTLNYNKGQIDLNKLCDK